ncbi:MAG: hypothetical protein H7246_21835 [Phycisphaerae bacterium]|nr:hypothetical protein [Saprospiraceae bacterium]
MNKTLVAILLLLNGISVATAQSPLFYAYGNIQSRGVITANTYNITISNFNGGYREYPEANYEYGDIDTGYVVWAGCVRFQITQVVSTVPLVLRVHDALASGALDGTDLINYRIAIFQEAKSGNYKLGAFPNLSDGNAGSQAGLGPYDVACIQNYYKSQLALALSAGVSTTQRLSGIGTAISPLDIAQQGAANGQVLKWNGTSWAPGNDNTGETGSMLIVEYETITTNAATVSGSFSIVYCDIPSAGASIILPNDVNVTNGLLLTIYNLNSNPLDITRNGSNQTINGGTTVNDLPKDGHITLHAKITGATIAWLRHE